MRIAIGLIAASISLSGCAAVFTGTTDTIHIRSEEPGTKLFVDGKLIGKNSATHVLPRKGDHVIEAVKPGCGTATYPVPYSLNPATLLGIFLDLGLVSILVIDGLATGAAMRASTTNVVVTPDCRQIGG
jgi:hypothetical protein